jgi:hypothetical protein
MCVFSLGVQLNLEKNTGQAQLASHSGQRARLQRRKSWVRVPGFLKHITNVFVVVCIRGK